MNIAIIRAFVKLREFAASHKEMAVKLEQLERKVGGHDGQIRSLFEAIRQVIKPQQANRAASDSNLEKSLRPPRRSRYSRSR